MDSLNERMTQLYKEMEKLHKRHELAQTVGTDYFEPGKMEFLEQSDGWVDEERKKVVLRFEAKGTRYEGRTEQIEKVSVGNRVVVERDLMNDFNPNNFTLLTPKGKSLGHMPAELCNVIAPLYDGGAVRFERASVSFVEPISKRSRHAKQAVLFVELEMTIGD